MNKQTTIPNMGHLTELSIELGTDPMSPNRHGTVEVFPHIYTNGLHCNS